MYLKNKLFVGFCIWAHLNNNYIILNIYKYIILGRFSIKFAVNIYK